MAGTPLTARIRHRVEQLGRSPRDVSLKATGNAYYLRDLFAGKMRAPTLDVLQKLAAELNWTVAQLIGEQDPDYQPAALNPDVLRLIIVRTEEYLKREGLDMPVNDRVSLYYALHDAAAPEILAGGDFNAARFAAFIKLARSRAGDG